MPPPITFRELLRLSLWLWRLEGCPRPWRLPWVLLLLLLLLLPPQKQLLLLLLPRQPRLAPRAPPAAMKDRGVEGKGV